MIFTLIQTCVRPDKIGMWRPSDVLIFLVSFKMYVSRLVKCGHTLCYLDIKLMM